MHQSRSGDAGGPSPLPAAGHRTGATEGQLTAGGRNRPPRTVVPALVKRNRGSRASRALAVVVMLLAAQLVALAWPAYACGCGGMIARDPSRIAVDHEASAVSWDGRTERILMSLDVSGDAEEAAWIMPVPNRADVRLGSSRLFLELARLAAPEHRDRHYFWPRSGDWPYDDVDGAYAPGGGARGGGVDVVGRERLGPFDVASLKATDPDALKDWLDDNGFALPKRLHRELKPYVDLRWEYVAVRLAPGDDERRRVLGGTLQPLHLTFESERFVYPMRLSRAAKQPQNLRLYVLAPHRMRPSSAIGGEAPQVRFAGRVEKPADEVRAFARPGGGDTADGDPFLTVYEQDFPVPGRISGDHELRRAHSDAEYRTVVYHSRILTWGDVPVWIVTTGAAALALGTLVVWRVRARRRPSAEGG
ncbi:hypothetical protein GCM10012287_11340 [Streptomyces daqingensis]|uniref:DUF2330 domain-containing protein n=1 Tax=Streptomyces daqingensis TaxID=1472640 RepID=A0ABQ2LZ21_9ACTN|nr:hypothetical protein GCM10012287_11340 [Streptomyces daqingensis]